MNLYLSCQEIILTDILRSQFAAIREMSQLRIHEFSSSTKYWWDICISRYIYICITKYHRDICYREYKAAPFRLMFHKLFCLFLKWLVICENLQ